MNNDFQTWYAALLRKQVEDEIQFLVTNGHDNTFVQTPCMFCVEHHSGKHHCRRLKDLREFQSSIMSNIRTIATKERRRPIGTETIINRALELLDVNSPISNPFENNEPVFVMK